MRFSKGVLGLKVADLADVKWWDAERMEIIGSKSSRLTEQGVQQRSEPLGGGGTGAC
jgi:hypothetical protein